MSTKETIEEAIGVLQQLGLKEYEARCFVGLSRMQTGTAKRLSEVTEVPRTRVYDAIRVLEAQGLVEVQHGSPQRFRAVPIDEATETLQEQYEERVERLQENLDSLPRVESADDSPVQEVWSLNGATAIESRTRQLIEGANDEVVLVVGDESALTDELVATLNDAAEEKSVLIGAITEPLERHIHDSIPNATTYISGLEWLHGMADASDETAVGQLLLVDRQAILVSTLVPNAGSQHAIFGTGFGNGLVVIARRLMAHGLLTKRDPGKHD